MKTNLTNICKCRVPSISIGSYIRFRIENQVGRLDEWDFFGKVVSILEFEQHPFHILEIQYKNTGQTYLVWCHSTKELEKEFIGQ